MMKKRNITSRLNKVDYLIFSFCSIFAVASLFLFYKDMNSFSIKQNEEPIATISFKENTVQRKLDNRNIWEKVNLACDIYNGDSLRTSSESKVIAAFLENDVKINLDENSMIQLFKNKKKDFIDFISGEIHIENTSSDAPIIIHAGTKAISIMANSKAKLTAVENDNSDELPSEAIIEVESGEVEIAEIDESKVNKANKIEESKVVLSAGNKLEISLKKENPVEQKVVAKEPEKTETKIEIEQSVDSENSEEIVIEQVEEKNEGKIEDVKKSEVKSESKNTKAAEKSVKKEKPVEKPIEPERIEVEEPISFEIKEPVFTEVADNSSKEKHEAGIVFMKSIWEGGHNHGYTVHLNELFGSNKKIAKGATLEVTISGISNITLTNLNYQVSTGERDWKIAIDKSVVVNSVGIKAGEKFEYSTNLYLSNDIIDTNSAVLNICYEPYVADEGAYIKDFSMSAKLVRKEIVPLAKDYKNEVTYDYVDTAYSTYKNQDGVEVWDGRFYFDPGILFGHYTSIEEETKIKLTIEGEAGPNTRIEWMTPELVQNIDYNWMDCFKKTGSEDYINLVENAPILSNKKFSITKIFTVKRKVVSTDTSDFHLIFSLPNQKNPKEKAPKINNCKITVEVM